MGRVFLCARGGSLEIPAIEDALRERKAEPVVLDSAAFPTSASLSLAYDGADFHGSFAREATTGLTAVWQCLVVGTALPAMTPGARETCVTASELALIGLLDSLGVFQLDPQWAKARADNKPHQLRVAQRLGLEIPATIISNDPDAVRAFARDRGPLVMKMLVQPASTGPSTDEAEVMFTTALTDLDQLDGLDLCPMIFQEQIANHLDVRVTIVGKQLFAAAIDATARGGDDLDWRRQGYALDHAPTWAPYQLPAHLEAQLFALLDHYGLNYGAADFIAHPDGRLVFLELNASGAFAFLGPALSRAIAAAIADVLVDPAARRHG